MPTGLPEEALSQLERILDLADLNPEHRQTLLKVARHDPAQLAALLRPLRPANPRPTLPITAIEAWRALVNPPPNPSPELQVYIDYHKEREQERRKWDMPTSEERFRKWDQLDKLGRGKKVWADQASLLKDWLKQHPERIAELVARFARPGAPSNKRNLPNSYHWSGLYWLAANVVFERFYMQPIIAKSIFDRVKYFWPELQRAPELDPARREALETAAGEAYVEARRRLSRGGVHVIPQLERWVVRTVRKHVAGRRLVDPERRRKERRAKKKGYAAQRERFSEEETTLTSEEESDVNPISNDRKQRADDELLDPERGLQFVSSETDEGQEDEALDFLSKPHGTLEATSGHDPFQTAELAEFISTLPARHKAVFGDLVANPILTKGDLAARYHLTPQRIGQILDEIMDRWHSR